jgi:hypothetical protein
MAIMKRLREAIRKVSEARVQLGVHQDVSEALTLVGVAIHDLDARLRKIDKRH